MLSSTRPLRNLLVKDCVTAQRLGDPIRIAAMIKRLMVSALVVATQGD